MMMMFLAVFLVWEKQLQYKNESRMNATVFMQWLF
jgi:hypothetical protein